MAAGLTDTEKIQHLPWMLWANTLNVIFCTFTVFGSAFLLFLNELGMNKTRIGVLLSLMPFCGLIALFIAPIVAQFGFKRIFLIFFGIRKFVIGLLLLTPFIISRFGHPAALRWVGGIIFLFAFCRAIAETSSYPWTQEVIPDSVRGKFGGIQGILGTLVQIVAIAVVSYVVGRFIGLGKYMFLIASGVVIGLAAVVCFSFVPGGKPNPSGPRELTNFREMLQPLTDRNFILFLAGLALVTLGMVSSAFIPLFMMEQVGLTLRKVVLLDISTAMGGLLFCYLWGWTADRYGGKPVMLSGLGLMFLVPIGCILLPRHHAYSNLLAGTIAFVLGIANTGWGIGSGRYLYVGAVPTAKKSSYMAVFYALIGLAGGIGPLLAGRFLDYCQGINGKVLFPIDSYVPLFAIGFLFLSAGMVLLMQVRNDGTLPTKKFLSMFLQGNPFMAFEALMRFGLTRTETSRISTVELLGHSRNPLSINEITEALRDPSFNVRYEATISAAKMPLNPALLDALITVLRGKEPGLAITAAGALGRTNDPNAILPLRETLPSEYRMLKAHCARSLAMLGDTASIPTLYQMLKEETDENVRVALASALGTLRADVVTDELLSLLKKTTNAVYRSELSFALACLLGEEERFIQLWRRSQTNISLVAVQTISALTKRLGRIPSDEAIEKLCHTCSREFARERISEGSKLLSALLAGLPAKMWDDTSGKIVGEVTHRLIEFGEARPEYILLALHLLSVSRKRL